MKASEFDFVRFREYRAEREEKLRAFLDGTCREPVLFEEKTHTGFETCRTAEESLERQLDGITRQMDADSDYVPYLEPWFGVGVFANAFGAEYVWIDGESPQTHYLVHNEEQAARLDRPTTADAPVMKLVLDTIDYYVEQTRGEIPIVCTDTQSPLDTATLLWDTASFFTAVHTAPEVVHQLLDRITELVIEFSREQAAHTGAAWAQPGHIMPSTVGGTGLSLSEDNIVMVSPADYETLAVPYCNRIAEAFGGVAIHSCGNFEQQLPALAKTTQLCMVDGAFSRQGDPNPNTDLELFRDTFAGTDTVLHARMGRDWAEQLPRLVHPDLQLIVAVPGPGEGQPSGLNRRLLEETLFHCA